VRLLVAPQEFKGTLTARQAAEAICRGVLRAKPDWEVDVVPLADGGPGTVDAFLAACGGESRKIRCADPLGREVEAAFALLPEGDALWWRWPRRPACGGSPAMNATRG
jgi:glycerate kinase